MFTRTVLFCFFYTLVTACSDRPESPATVSETLAAPVARKVPHEFTAFGETRIDNYHWMRDDTRSDPEILEHLEAENAYTQAILAPLLPLKEEIFQEMVGRLEKDKSSVPALQNGYWYYSRFSGDMEYPIYARKQSLDGTAEVLLDGNQMASGHDYFEIGDYSVSSNNAILAYSTDTLSRRLYDIEFKNLETGAMYEDRLQGTSGEVVWANDNQTVYYIRKDPQTLLPYQVFRHRLGTTQEEDSLVYEEDNSAFYTSLGKSKDRAVIYIHHASKTSSGTSLLDANASEPEPKVFLPLEKDHEYSIAKLGDDFYILSNWQAANFRLMKVNGKQHTDKAAWKEVIPHRVDIFLEDFALFDDHLVVKERRNGQGSVSITRISTGKREELAFDDEVYVVDLYRNVELNTKYLRVYYSSPTTPGSVFDISLDSLRKELKKQDKILGGFDRKNYGAERIFVPARDGKEIPVTLVYRKDLFSKDGTNPLYQYGYGSYGDTLEPYFNPNWLSLTDRGFVVSIAHVRGSEMLGRSWYEDGKMLHKKNTFTDFIDVTRGLVLSKYADAHKVYAEGGSAGGLLIGAVMNVEPGVYDGVAAHVPFVDVITTMSDPTIPLTTLEYIEWGNPANRDEYDYMLSYSPYDQVAAIEYPHTLVTTGLHDSQVQYFEAMKWVAKLRELKTGKNTLVFDVNMEAGHGGASGRFRRLETYALTYAFFIDLAGCGESTPESAQPTSPALARGAAAITEAGYRDHIRVLASDEFGGRGPATPAEELTVSYLVDTFQSLGLAPANGDSYTQDVPLMSVEVINSPTLTISSEKEVDLVLAYGTDQVIFTRRQQASSALEASDLVFVGYGINAPERGWNDYADVDVRGKTVVMLINDPGFATQDPALFNGNTMTYYGRWDYKYDEAARQGAAAAIIIHDTKPAAYPWSTVQTSWSGPQFDVIRPDAGAGLATIEGWITVEKAAALFTRAGLDAGELYDAARKPGFRAVPLPLRASATLQTRTENVITRNVAAVLKGSEAPEELFVYMAHWDHLGTDASIEGDGIYNGALDNATGTAGLLELARAYASLEHPPRRSVMFLAVTAEEQGLLGSLFYAANPLHPLASTLAGLNMDGLNNYGRTRDVTVIGYGFSELDKILGDAAAEQSRMLGADPEAEKGFYFRSDHFELAKLGVPMLYPKHGYDHLKKGVEYGKVRAAEYIANHYHQVSDEYSEDWDVSGALEDLRLYFATGYRIADTSSWPNWNEGTEFKIVRDAQRAEQ